ncbi:MAG: hypothetical protein RI988_2058 [Pseudomonadota bacterium]|jgi:hypothetical protein
MATVKISALPPAALPLGGTEFLELVQGGVSVRAPSSAVAASYATDAANVLPVTAGGTGLTGYVTGDMVYATSATSLSAIAAGGANKVLLSTASATFTASISSTTMVVTLVSSGVLIPGMVLSGVGVTGGTTIVEQLTGTTGGAGTYEVSIAQSASSVVMTGINSTAPAWGVVDLTAAVTGALPATNGGTGQSSYSAGNMLYATGTAALGVVPPSPATGAALLAGASASFTGTISSTTLTVSAVASGLVTSGMALAGSGVSGGTTITGQLTGTPGGAGTYSVSISQTVAPVSMTGSTSATTPTWGYVGVAGGGTGAGTLTGYVKGNGVSAMTASPTVPFLDLAGRAQINASSTLDQTGSTSTATAFTMNTGTTGTGITVNASTQITFTAAGTYMLNPSIQFKNTDAADHTATVWFRKNGVDIANSASVVSVPKAADGGVTVLTVSIIEAVTAGQYIEVMWLVSNVAVTADATAVGAIAPAIPSIIVPALRIA